MKDPIKLKDLIISKIDMSKLMMDYNVSFIYSPENASEVQYRCPFHGKDNKPSARFYRRTNSAHCFKCRKTWNPVSFIMDKENFNFIQSVNYLINRYNIDTSSISDDPEFKDPESKPVSREDVKLLSIKNNIREYRGKISFDKYRALCFAYYMISFKKYKNESIIKDIEKLESKIRIK